MKHNKIYNLLAASVICAAASAQSLNSAYFMDGFTYRHQLNPAFASERNYVGFPVLSNINVGTQGNVGLANFLYPYNNQLTTFMHESVDTKSFLDGLKGRNKVNANVNLTFFSGGFQAWGGFNTIDLNLRSNTNLTLPYELFEFMKAGQTSANTVYDMGTIGMRTNNYIELAMGHSRQLTEKLRVGAKMKFLFGGANAHLRIDDMKVVMSEDKWVVEGNGKLDASVAGLVVPTNGENGKELDNPKKDVVDYDNIDFNTDNAGLSGFGMAFDFGATYKLRDDITLSASVLDFGFISWKNTITAATSNEPWEFDGFHEIAIKSDMGSDDPNSIDTQADKLVDELEGFTNLYRTGVDGKKAKMLGATLNIGAEYIFPYYDRLKFGFLSSTRIQGAYTWSEGRISANVAPLKWFEANVNYALSSFGSSFGWLLNFHGKGASFFIGSDYTIGKVNTQFIPLNNMNANVSLGFNITFGSKHKPIYKCVQVNSL